MEKPFLCKAALTLMLCLSAHAQAQGGARSQATNTGTQAMAADANPSFEVATIRPSDPDHPIDGTPIGHRTVFAGTTLLFLTAFVYDVHEKQIVGIPDWMATEKFDFTVVADTPGAPSLQQLKIMFRKLFADRFQLKFHTEQRALSAYVLTVAPAGSKLISSKEEATGQPSLLGRPQLGMHGRNLSMAEFARLLQSGILDRPVVDRTLLPGKYDFVLKWTPDETQFNQAGAKVAPPSDTAEIPGLFTALREQLGLKIEAKRAHVDVLVIDRVERPSPN